MAFYDLCINFKNNDKESLRRLLTRLYEMGYRTVAINQTVDESILETEPKEKKKNQSDHQKVVIEPYQLDDLRKEFDRRLNILSRLTFSFTDSAKTYLIRQANTLNKFDLYAVIPKGQAAFQFACTQLNADIITINSSSSGLKLNRKLYSQAVERGSHFEIQYKDLISPATRKMALHYSHLFFVYGKSKNVVISSGAADYNSIRNPYDIINLPRGTILGLSELKAKRSIHEQCRHLILKSEARRFGKGIFAIFNAEDDMCGGMRDQKDENKTPDAKKLKLQDSQ